ncbi:MAG: hypothetical protein ABSH50_28175 [Bryobacteraceae bacterium]|jgi:anti-sigma factor RsiW
MTHPSQSDLALYAGSDLGWLGRQRVARHLAGCRECRGEVQAFAAVSQSLTELNTLPEISWNRLAGEMKANIRLGLAAGECVREGSPSGPLSWLSNARALTACACGMALLVAGLYLQRPAPPAAPIAANGSAILRTTANGIELDQGGETLSLIHEQSGSVTYSAGAQGSMRAGYVDADGHVTINDVYVQ